MFRPVEAVREGSRRSLSCHPATTHAQPGYRAGYSSRLPREVEAMRSPCEDGGHEGKHWAVAWLRGAMSFGWIGALWRDELR